MKKQLTKNFNLYEFHCYDRRGKTMLMVAEVPERLYNNVVELAVNLQVLRDYLNAPISFNSAFRSEWYNHMVKGSDGSKHKEAMAGDITAKGYTNDQVADAIEYLISKGKMKNGGLGRYNSFTHYDVRSSPARWDNR